MGKFKAWLEGYLDSIGPGVALTKKDVEIIRERMARTKKRSGFTDEEVANVEASTIGIDREPHDWWRNQFYVGVPADEPKSDPTAVAG